MAYEWCLNKPVFSKKKKSLKTILKKKKKTILSGTSLAVQWLRLHLVKEWKVPHAAKPIASLQAANSKGHCSLSHSGLASQQPDSCPFPPLAFHDITCSGFSRITHHACSVSFAGFSTSLWMLEGPRLCVGPSYHLYRYFIPFGVYSILSHKFTLLIFTFWSRLTACGILVPRPGKEPVTPALEAQNLNHCTLGRSLPWL